MTETLLTVMLTHKNKISFQIVGLGHPMPKIRIPLAVIYFIGESNLCQVMRKLDSYLREKKGADQLCSNCEADQHLCFCCMDSTITLLLIGEFNIRAPKACLQLKSKTTQSCFNIGLQSVCNPFVVKNELG